jgi:hypothetical protein
MTHHTPGPWFAAWDCIVANDPTGQHEDLYLAEIVIADDEGRIVSPEEQGANARLIAAAPDMLAALQDVLEFWDDPNTSVAELKGRLRDAIAKAKGGAA